MSRADELMKKRRQLSPEQALLLEKRLRGNPSATGVRPAPAGQPQDDAATVTALAPQPPLEADAEAMRGAARRQAEAGASLLEAQNFDALSRKLNRLAVAYVNNALVELGAFASAGEGLTHEELTARLGITPDHRKVTAWWLLMLAEEGRLLREGERFVSPGPLDEFALDESLREVRAAAAGTSYEEIVAAIETNGRELAGIITGRKHALENFFSEGSSKVADQAYGLSPEALYFSGIMKAALSPLARALPEGRELRVLEVGGGVGGTTTSLLPALAGVRTRYVFTDISPFFLENARAKFAAYPFVNYALLNVDREPEAQGFRPHTFDLVVASNVLHCASFVAESLRRLGRLLGAGGTLLILEGTRNEYWHSIVMGLLKGFMNFEDERLRTHQPFLSYEGWEDALRAAGFDGVAAFPEPGGAADLLGQHVIIARAP